jgi:tetratricopeptide (TPR) repeat protein
MNTDESTLLDATGQPAAGRTIGGRYVVQQLLGRGGMAAVFEVTDLQSGRAQALKRLDRHEDVQKRQRTARLFEREYHTLSQLVHPRVVQVHDYAVDDYGPYYTMELLDGGDLHKLAPVPWRQACAIARDVCSALSLLHSRGAMHRDVSPRNVRCAQDGSAKLIDFGALAPMGPCKILMGTPPCCAPEIVHMQTLDARTDLYALGATLYYTLVGRHAFPARQFMDLSDSWLAGAVPPSQLVAEIPEALDALVLDLLRLDPNARPSSAAEVMQRVSVIDGCAVDEGLLVANAYLSTPTLVGRAKELTRARLKIKRSQLGRGCALTIRGVSGVGRSRLLDACVLDATLLGATVIRTDADHTQGGDYGVLRTIARELQQRLPDALLAAAQPQLDLLAHALPELLALAPGVTPRAIEPELLRSQLQPALREWLLALCQHKPLVIAIDDFQRIDEPSATLFALLAQDLRRRALMLIVSIETGASAVSEAVCKLLIESASDFTLQSLSLEDTELLMSSLFGDAPNVAVLSHRLHTVASGNPADLMRLAQHLVDRKTLRYASGAWTLPAELEPRDLPPSVHQALLERVESLSSSARELALALALCPDLRFSLAECAILTDCDANAPLDELLEAKIISEVQDDFRLAQQAWGEVLREAVSSALLTRLHARLAQTLRGRPDQEFRVGQHLLLAEQPDAALDLLVAHAITSQENTAHDADLFLKYVQGLPPDWWNVFAQAVQLCEERRRPPRERFALLSRLSGIVAMLAIDDKLHQTKLLQDLKQYSGLSDWEALDPAMEAMPRLVKALEQTQARYNAASELERVLDPLDAIRQLARGMITQLAVVALSMEVRDLNPLPSLTPLLPLSPALSVVDLLIQGMRARYTAHNERALEIYKELLERTAQADRAGLDVSHARYMRMGVMNGVGMIEAGFGRASCLPYAQQLEADPSHCVNALQIRALYDLWQGDAVSAERRKRDVDRVRIQNSARHWFEGSHLMWEITAYALSDDLTHIQHTIEELTPLQQRYPAWRPVAQYAAANLQRVRGDYARALSDVVSALSQVTPEIHQIWVHLATTHLQVLVALDRHADALALGERYLEQAARSELGYVAEYLRMTLAVAQAKLGHADAATRGAGRAIAQFEALGITGLNLGLAYEARARVAIALGVRAEFEHYAMLCRGVFCERKNRALSAKHQKLMRDAERANVIATRERHTAISGDVTTSMSTMLTLFDRCHTSTQRAKAVLSLLQRHSGADHGYMFAIGNDGPQCLAASDEHEPPETMVSLVSAYVTAELDEADTTATGDTLGTRSLATEWVLGNGDRCRAILLSHQVGSALAITGVALLVSRPDKPFVRPAQLASKLSKLTSDAGDHSVMVSH